MHTQPAEDIESVIGRFQAWAGSRTAAQPKPGIRELTYEEALASRRGRWPNAARNTPRQKRQQEPASPPEDAPPPAAAKATARHKSQPEKTHGAARKAAVKASARTASPAHAKKARSSQDTKAAPAPPAFREVLASAILPTESLATAQPADLARQVAISIRLAPAERAMLRTRAAEAGVTVSAYVRQCALEVEQLREQVRQALAAVDQRTSAAEPTPEQLPAPLPGLLTRLMRRLLPASTPKLALRA